MHLIGVIVFIKFERIVQKNFRYMIVIDNEQMAAKMKVHKRVFTMTNFTDEQDVD